MRVVEASSPDSGRQSMVDLGSWELAADGSVISYSAGFAAVLGLQHGDTITIGEWEALILSEDLPGFRAALDACMRDGSGVSEHRIVRADGTLRVVIARCDAEWLDGEQRLRGAVVDITAPREAETRQRAATSLLEQGFDAAPIGMSMADPCTGRYLRVNDALCDMLGRSRNELLDRSIADLTHPDDRELTAAAVSALIQEGAPGYYIEKRYLRPDGTVVWAEVHVASIRDAEGQVEALYAQKIDITERKEREASQAVLVREAEWLARIREALDRDRMVLYSQPIVDLRSGEVVQRELLLRMLDEAGEVITPNEFLPVAEQYGLMPEIDRWVIRQAVRTAAESGPVEFNLSAASVGDPLILTELSTAIETTGADPADLVIEVTETAMLDRAEIGHGFAKRVSDLGCGLALDDFGTGFSSLSYLKAVPADHLKIDIEFVRDLANNETDQRLVRGIVGLAAEFDQTTTAEGIEDEQTLSKLLQLGVVRGQGYLFGHPAPIEKSSRSAPATAATGRGYPDRVQTVRAIFRAFEDRDVRSAETACHPQCALRPLRSDRITDPYRGRESIARYFRDVDIAWDELSLHPSAYWTTHGSVIAFGRVIAAADGRRHTTDAMWVFRFREGLISSIDVFEQARLTGNGRPRREAPRDAASSGLPERVEATETRSS